MELASTFPAVLAPEPGGAGARLVELGEDELEPGEVTVAVAWSSLNYKDALALTGTLPVVRRLPAICGIDLAGEVVASGDPDLAPGTPVVVTGFGMGEGGMRGGYAGRARVRPEWCVPLRPPLDPRRAMAIGTAGLTAMLAVLALERQGLLAEGAEGPVLVTGATGGVGSVAVALLAALGHEVVASTGRPEEAGYLERLGARSVIERGELAGETGKRLLPERFAAAVDVVGGRTLANVLAATRRGGAVAACGLVGGGELPATVHPFILRGVSLIGIESGWVSPALRREAWAGLGEHLPLDLVEAWTSRVGMELEGLLGRAGDLLAGRVRGRLVVEVAGG